MNVEAHGSKRIDADLERHWEVLVVDGLDQERLGHLRNAVTHQPRTNREGEGFEAADREHGSRPQDEELASTLGEGKRPDDLELCCRWRLTRTDQPQPERRVPHALIISRVCSPARHERHRF